MRAAFTTGVALKDAVMSRRPGLMRIQLPLYVLENSNVPLISIPNIPHVGEKGVSRE